MSQVIFNEKVRKSACDENVQFITNANQNSLKISGPLEDISLALCFFSLYDLLGLFSCLFFSSGFIVPV